MNFASIFGSGTDIYRWQAMPKNVSRDIFGMTFGNAALTKAIAKRRTLAFKGGFRIEGLNVPPSLIPSYQEFFEKGLIYDDMFGMIPIRAIKQQGHIIPVVPDFSTGQFIFRINRKTRMVEVAWSNNPKSGDGGVMLFGPAGASSQVKPDPNTLVFVWSRPTFATAAGFVSRIVTLLQSNDFHTEIRMNYLDANWSLAHPEVWMTYESRRNSTMSTSVSGKKVEMPPTEYYATTVDAKRRRTSTSAVMRTREAEEAVRFEESHMQSVYRSKTKTANLHKRVIHDAGGMRMEVNREAAHLRRVPVAPGWTPQQQHPPAGSDRILELEERWERVVMGAYGLPLERYHTSLKKDSDPSGEAKKGGGGGSSMGDRTTEELRDSIMEARNKIESLFDVFAMVFLEPSNQSKGGPASEEEAEKALARATEAIRGQQEKLDHRDYFMDDAVRAVMERLRQKQLKAPYGHVPPMLDGTSDLPDQDREENEDGQSKGQAKVMRDEDGEVVVRDLASYIVRLAERQGLDDQPFFAQAKGLDQMEQEEAIRQEANAIANRIYEQAVAIDVTLDEGLIRQEILESKWFRDRLEAIEEEAGESVASKMDQINETSIHLEWGQPPMYDPNALIPLAMTGSLNAEAVLRTALQQQMLPESTIEEFLKGVDFKSIMEQRKKEQEKAAAKPAAGGGSSSSKPKPKPKKKD